MSDRLRTALALIGEVAYAVGMVAMACGGWPRAALAVGSVRVLAVLITFGPELRARRPIVQSIPAVGRLLSRGDGGPCGALIPDCETPDDPRARCCLPRGHADMHGAPGFHPRTLGDRYDLLVRWSDGPTKVRRVDGEAPFDPPVDWTPEADVDEDDS